MTRLTILCNLPAKLLCMFFSALRLSPGRRRRCSAASIAAFLLTSSLAVATASAAPTPPTDWSGQDTRQLEGTSLPAGVSGPLVDLSPRNSLSSAGAAYKHYYGTVNQFGENALSSGAIFLPPGPAPAGGWPVIAWAHGTTGLGDACAPSALPRSERDTEYLNHWLDQGYAIVATDYAGLGTPGLLSYLNGEVAAHNIVDSVAAARSAGLPLSATYAIVGQSQGAGAAMNAAARATGLSAPYGLDYRGVVATGTPANIEAIYQWAGPGFPPINLPRGLNIYAIYIMAALRDAYPELAIDSYLTAEGIDALNHAETLCYSEMADFVGERQIAHMLVRPMQDVPNFYGVLRGFMGTPDRGYDRPVFLGQGLMDMDVPAPFALSLAAQMTLNQQPPELHVYPTEDHSSTVRASMPDSTAFLERVMR